MKYLIVFALLAGLALAMNDENDLTMAEDRVEQKVSKPAAPYHATKTGHHGLFDPYGFSSAVLVVAFAAFLGTIILLVLSGGSFLTFPAISVTGRKRRQSPADAAAQSTTSWVSTVFQALQKGTELWEKYH